MSRLPSCLILLVFALSVSARGADDAGTRLAHRAGRGLVGTPAPALVLRTLDGARIDLGALYGRKAVYLKFWATWCTICRAQMPHLKRTFAEAGPDLAVIAVDIGFEDTPQAVRAYRERVGLRMPIVFDDGRLAQAFHLRVTPQSVVIGRDGRVLYVGHEADARLDAAVREARRKPAAVAHAAVSALPPLRALRVGERVPALAAETLDGVRTTLPSAADPRPLALVFLSPWCETYLADSRPELVRACRAARERVQARSGDPRVRWLGIASGLWADRARLQRYRREHAIRMPLALDADGALFRRFGVMQVPTVLLVDGRGRLAARIEGDAGGLDAALARLSPPRS